MALTHHNTCPTCPTCHSHLPRSHLPLQIPLPPHLAAAKQQYTNMQLQLASPREGDDPFTNRLGVEIEGTVDLDDVLRVFFEKWEQVKIAGGVVVEGWECVERFVKLADGWTRKTIGKVAVTVFGVLEDVVTVFRMMVVVLPVTWLRFVVERTWAIVGATNEEFVIATLLAIMLTLGSWKGIAGVDNAAQIQAELRYELVRDVRSWGVYIPLHGAGVHRI